MLKNLVYRPRTDSPFLDLVNEFFDLKGDFSTLKSVFDYTPSVKTNIQEMEDKYILELTLAGFNKDDIKIDINNDILSISADIKEEKEEKEDVYCMRQFKKSSFKKSYQIPKDTNMDKIEAEFKDGILKLDIQKLEEKVKKPTKVVIK
jgi:HSP20 family protein